jgi:quinol monooxygenase YgiN
MKPGCTLIAHLHAKPEKRDELLKLLQSFVKPSRAESACVEYHLHVSNDDPNLFVFYENWRTREGLVYRMTRLSLETHARGMRLPAPLFPAS